MDQLFNVSDRVMVVDKTSSYCGWTGIVGDYAVTYKVVFRGPHIGPIGVISWFYEHNLIKADSLEAMVFQVLES